MDTTEAYLKWKKDRDDSPMFPDEVWDAAVEWYKSQQAEAEPIAWTWKYAGRHVTADKAFADQLRADGVPVLPLYTTPQPAQPAPVQVPEGWKLVPVEPTPEMLAAGKYALEADCYASGIYADMLAATPPPAPAVESRPLPVNRYGVDRDYFTKKLEILIRDMDNYTQAELARSLGRLAMTADSETMREPEFNTATAVHGGGEPLAVMYENGTVLTKADCGDSFATCCKVQTPLYTHPQPVPVQAPDEMTPTLAPGRLHGITYDGNEPEAYADGWNDCRKVMLSTTPQPQEGE